MVERVEKPATFRVRFESYDDFLVEYTDRLRHGFAVLPLPSALPPGSPVRLRLHLPDDRVLALSGVTETARPVERTSDAVAPTRVALAPLSDAQTQTLQSAVDAMLSAPSLRTPPDPAVEPAAAAVISVLLVDDSVSARIELGDAFRARGIRVRVAENGLVALSAAIKRPPDIVLTDVEMPVMDGWTLLRTLRGRAHLSAVSVVFLTRMTDEDTRLRGYRMGVDDYLPKTMPADEIVARLQGVLARRRQARNDSGEGLRGTLEHVRLGSLLAFLESERRGGALNLQRGSDWATLHIRDGALEHVENLGRAAHPHDRVFELLGWDSGVFELIDAPSPAADRASGSAVTPLSYLLMEHVRRQDEAAANDGVVPSTRAPH